jgi:hypothetical protein
MTHFNNPTKLLFFITALALAAMACAIGATPGADPDAGILFSDDFSSRSHAGWDQYSDAQGSTDYGDGNYSIRITDSTWIMWSNPGETFDNVRVEVDATFVAGELDQNSFGLICRHQDIDNFYALLIASDGYYAIRKRTNGGELEIISGEFYEFNEAIRTGQATNHIVAECNGSILRLSANGTTLAEVVDSELTSGDVGLIGTTFDGDLLEVTFDNLVVYQP